MTTQKTKTQSLVSKAFNLTYLETSRYNWVDYVKGIAILLVVYRHVLIGIERTGLDVPSYLVNANMIFYSFRMPLFFILSGLFISASINKRTNRQLAWIKFEHLLYPYLIWATLQITLQIAFSSFTNASRGLEDYAYILYQPRNLDQFWYLPALFNVTMIYLLVKTKLGAPVWLQLLLGAALYFLSAYCRPISMIADWMEFYLFFALGDAVSRFFFQPLIQKKLSSTILLLAISPVFVIVQLYYLTKTEDYFLYDQSGRVEFIAISLIGCISMFILAFNFQKWGILSFLRIIGFHSLYIYVMHVFVAAFVRIVFMKVFLIQSPLVLLICGIVFSITLCIAFYNLLIRNGPLWFLFSFRKEKPLKPQTEKQLSHS